MSETRKAVLGMGAMGYYPNIARPSQEKLS